MKRSRIWDFLATSKMELFVTMGIYKVIFCRLIILYTQYSSMSVFICVSSLPAPFCSRCFHLQMVFFDTITIANVEFYWGMVLHTQFLPINFFFVCVSSLLSPYRSRQFQLVLGGSSSFQVVPPCSRWLQLVPTFSMYENSNNRATKRNQHNEISLNLLFCYYFSPQYLLIILSYYQLIIKFCLNTIKSTSWQTICTDQRKVSIRACVFFFRN